MKPSMHSVINLDALIASGEDSRHQFKRDIAHVDQLAAELVAFPGNVLHDTQYLDSEDIDGTLPQQYQRCIAFIKRNLHHVQGKQSFNSPGHLRNPALASHAFHMLPYRGLGSGIPRAVAAWPKLEFIDDRLGNQFKVVIKRGVQPPEIVNVGANHLFAYIQTNPGQRASEMATAYKLTQRTLERWLKQLKDQDLIEFRGATKTGGYYPKAGRNTCE